MTRIADKEINIRIQKADAIAVTKAPARIERLERIGVILTAPA